MTKRKPTIDLTQLAIIQPNTNDALTDDTGALVTGADLLERLLRLPLKAANPYYPDSPAWLIPYPASPAHKPYSLAAITMLSRLGLNQRQVLDAIAMSQSTYYSLDDTNKATITELLKRGLAYKRASLATNLDRMSVTQPSVAIFSAKNLMGWTDTQSIVMETPAKIVIEHSFLMPNVDPQNTHKQITITNDDDN